MDGEADSELDGGASGSSSVGARGGAGADGDGSGGFQYISTWSASTPHQVPKELLNLLHRALFLTGLPLG